MTKFIFVRHGQSLGNKADVFLGHTNLDLSETGYKQAKKAAEYITSRYKPDVIYSSDLLRAYNTALPTAELLGAKIITSPSLREIYAGEWENKAFSVLKTEYPEEYSVWLNDIGSSACVGGESVKDLFLRVNNALTEIAEENSEKTVFVFTHATVIRSMQCAWKGIPLSEMKNIPWVTNASVSEVEYSNGAWKEISIGYNDFMGELKSALPANV